MEVFMHVCSIVYMVYKPGGEFWRFRQFHPGGK